MEGRLDDSGVSCRPQRGSDHRIGDRQHLRWSISGHELIVLDFRSTDDTEIRAMPPGARSAVNRRCPVPVRPGKGEALSTGGQHSALYIVVFIDSDLINPHPCLCYGWSVHAHRRRHSAGQEFLMTAAAVSDARGCAPPVAMLWRLLLACCGPSCCVPQPRAVKGGQPGAADIAAIWPSAACGRSAS